MSVGERGGSTDTFDEGAELIDTFKPDLKARIKADILEWLEEHGEWHANDLRVPVPPESRNVMPSVVRGLKKSGRIAPTGERRKALDPASHGRTSDVYRLSGGGGSNRPAAAISRPPINEESRLRFESAIKWRIVESLVFDGEFRVESLEELRIPDEYRFLIREAIERAKVRGYMEGQHGLYEVTRLGRKELTKIVRDTSEPVDQEQPPEPAPTLPLDLPEPGPSSHYDAERKAA